MCRLAFLCLLPALVAFALVGPASAWLRKVYPSWENANALLEAKPGPVNVQDAADQSFSPPLFLTPYIEAGKLAEGRKLSAVTNLPGGAPVISSYSGFLTVNKQYNSNMFFWFFPPLVSCIVCDFSNNFGPTDLHSIPSDWQSWPQHTNSSVASRRPRRYIF